MVELIESQDPLALIALQQSLTQSIALRPADQPGYTFSEFEALTSEIIAEYVDGAIVLNPPPNFSHQQVATNLTAALTFALRAGPGTTARCHSGPFALLLDAVNSLLIPDLAVIIRPPADGQNFTATDLLVVIEILSPSNTPKDTIRNFGLYSSAGIAEYWIVDGMQQSIRVCTDPSTEGYGSVETISTGSVPIGSIRNVAINLSDIWR